MFQDHLVFCFSPRVICLIKESGFHFLENRIWVPGVPTVSEMYWLPIIFLSIYLSLNWFCTSKHVNTFVWSSRNGPDFTVLQNLGLIRFNLLQWKSWLRAQHSENEDHGIWSHHLMGNRWGNSGNSVRLYFSGLQNHCRWWLQPWN